MSILIRGMEMPTACRGGECKFACVAEYQTRLICVVRNQYVVPGSVPYDCPCSIVPPHGRLIDADALLHDVKLHSESYFADDFAHEWVDVAPTIIPASEED